jgi:Uri superfamily endonuclease
MSRPPTYPLHFELARPLRCAIGRFGGLDIPAGRHACAGSARRGLAARIARHLRAHRTLRWPIDDRLAAPGVQLTRVLRSGRDECVPNPACRGTAVVHGFGASDCRHGHGAQLKYLGAATSTRGRASSRL